MPRMTYRLAKTGLALCTLLLAGCPTIFPPSLNVSRVAFNFSSTIGIDSFTIANDGGGVLEWAIDPVDVPNWLDLSVRGTEKLDGVVTDTSQVVTMTLNAEAAALAPGTHQDTFTVMSNGGDQLVSVAILVTLGGALILDPTTLDFGATISSSSFTIGNGGTESLTWTLQAIAVETPWLQFVQGTPNTGTITTNVQTIGVTVDRTDLEAGEYTGSIRVTSDAGEGTITVTMTVPDSSGQLSVSPESLTFQTAGLDNSLIAIRNAGAGTITWTAQDDFPAWLSISVRSDTVGQEIDRPEIRVNASELDPGQFTHNVVISSVDEDDENSGSDSILVTLTVPEPTPVLSVNPTAFSFSGVAAEGLFTITNEGTGQLNWSLTVNDPLISIAADDPSSGAIEREAQVIDFQVNAATLPAGANTGTISITSDGGDATVTITIDVPPPTLEVVPRVLNFSTNLTQKLVAIFNAGTGTVNWSIDTSTLPDWLRDGSGNPLISVQSGAVNGTETDGVTISVNRLNQAPGDFAFASPGIVVNSDAGQRFIEVFMEVAENPVLVVDTGANVDGVPNVDLDNVPFVPAGLENSASFSLQNVGTGTINWSVDDSAFPSWLSLDELGPRTLDATDGRFLVNVTIDRDGLPFGPFNHTLFIESNDADNSLQPVRVEMSVPKRVVIDIVPERLDLGTTGTTDEFFVVNCGDPDTVLNFGITSNKSWLFAFPTEGRSIGVEDCALNGDFQQIGVSVDRTGLDGAGGGTGILTIFAQSLQPDTQDVDGDGDTTELILKRDDNVAAAREVEVSVEAAELFFETPPVRQRVPSLIRYIMMMRNLRFETIPLGDETLPTFNRSFRLFENDSPIELVESNQFLTSANNLRTQIVILMDYSASMLESVALAQQYHEDVLAQLGEDFPNETFPDFPGFADAPDPLQFLYETCVGSLIDELPETYEIALMEFHDRNQPARILTTSLAFPTGFVPNDSVVGRPFLEATLQGLTITGHGATELNDALIEANNRLVSENSPAPSISPVVPVVPFDDADIRGIIAFSDGRNTSSFFTLSETSLVLQSSRTRLFAVAWGDDFNGGPLGLIASETGGHLYITRELDSGTEDGSGNPIRVPALGTLFDWSDNENIDADTTGSDECDLSISQDLRNQVVLSYVTLDVADVAEGRVAANFDDPNDGNETVICRLPDQGDIAGEFVQALRPNSVIGTDALGLGVRLGQISMRTVGIQNGQVEVFLFVDYMPRDIIQLDFTVAAEAPMTPGGIDALLVGVEGVPFAEEGIFENDWTLVQTASGTDITTGLATQTYRLTTGAGGEPIQYGAFGRLVKFTLDVPGLTPYDFRLLTVGNLTRNAEARFFTHPDGIDVEAFAVRAPSFPTPRVTPTILNFGTTSTFQTFTVENVGGAYAPGGIVLDFHVVGDSIPDPDLLVAPFFGRLISTDNLITVTVTLNRSKTQVGPINDIGFDMLYFTGIAEIAGAIPIVVTGTILSPVLQLTPAPSGATFLPNSTTLDFGTDPQASGSETQAFLVTNAGQSKLSWFRTNQEPNWLLVSAPNVVTAITPQTVLVTVDRSQLLPGQAVTHTLQISAQTVDTGTSIGSATVTINAAVAP